MARKAANAAYSAFFRLKDVDYEHMEETKLARCLSTFDLTALGKDYH